MRGDTNHIQDWCCTWFDVGCERSGCVVGEADVEGKGRIAFLKEGVAYKAGSQFNYRIIIDIHMRGGGIHILGLVLHHAWCQSLKKQKSFCGSSI